MEYIFSFFFLTSKQLILINWGARVEVFEKIVLCHREPKTKGSCPGLQEMHLLLQRTNCGYLVFLQYLLNQNPQWLGISYHMVTGQFSPSPWRKQAIESSCSVLSREKLPFIIFYIVTQCYNLKWFPSAFHGFWPN